jgi:3-oxoacid CoA-transferase subunit A
VAELGTSGYKFFFSASEAVAAICTGASIAVGGFGLSGIPTTLIDALAQTKARGLRIVSNNCGTDGWGLGKLLEQRRVARVIASYVGENKEFARQYLSGELELELVPQGTLAERLRSGGVGIPAFFTPAGVGTQVGDGGLPWMYDASGEVAVASPPKEQRDFDPDGRGPRTYLLEHAIVTDFALVRAWKGDTAGNLVYRGAARNFNPLCAMAARVTIAEVENLVMPGELDPAMVHTPGIFVDRVVHVSPTDAKRIEKRTTRGPRPEGALNADWNH